MSERAAAVVIGASIGGLAAAAYLARGGVHTLLLDARAQPREPAEALAALDARIIAELRLLSRGLVFSAHDLPLAVAGETPLLLGRNLHAASAAMVKFSDADAMAWPLYSRSLLAQARRLRRWWWMTPDERAPDALWGWSARRAFQRLCLTGADAYLGQRFETPALLAALLWDAGAGGFSVSEPGSMLALVWRAAQEMEGRQSAAAVARPGTLIGSLTRALGMAQFRREARVTRILSRAGGVTGVVLADGSEIEADHVISTLSRPRTLSLAGLPESESPVAEAKILLHLEPDFARPAFPPARNILADRPEVHADAHEAARAGRVAANLPMEWVMLAPELIAVTARPVPSRLSSDQRARLAAQAVLALSRAMPGLAAALSRIEIQLRPERARLADLLEPPQTRILTPIKGLFLAGEAAEPLPVPSGRAARLAARLVLSH